VNTACEGTCLRSIAADVDGVTTVAGMRIEFGSDTLPGGETSQCWRRGGV
jgi:hypothetical protein